MKTHRSQSQVAGTLPQCIWMKAGVVGRKGCQRHFQCQGCRFDRALRKTAGENRALRRQGRRPTGRRARIVFWQDKCNALPPNRRPCIHHLKERIEFKLCPRAYRCGDCEFDQYFDDQFTVHAVLKPVDIHAVNGFKFPQGYYLHHGHAWVRIEQNRTVRIGLDDFMQRLLGPFDHIRTPLLGQRIRRDRPDVLLTRGEKTARVRSPVSGIVTGVHADLRRNAGRSEKDPYGSGWTVKVQPTDLRRDLRRLMIGRESSDYLEKESARLIRTLERAVGPLAADGGTLSGNIFGKLPQLEWEALVERFLKT